MSGAQDTRDRAQPTGGRALEVQLLRSLRRDDEADTAELAYEARFGGSSD